ncbi:MAG: beta-ketoacyl-ACP synthase II [Anaerolineae bacterium]|nr:beta-ketoacyl-ACP synthase II [Anaerolineae bacterium]
MVRRVVVTGMGTVSPLGNDLDTTWNALVHGRSGVATIKGFDATDYRSSIAAEVKDFDPENHFSRRDIRRLDPFVQYALVAAREAVAQAQISFVDGLGERTAVIIGSGIGGMTTVTGQTEILLERGPSKVSPTMIPMILPESAASMVSIEFGLRGPNMAVTSACATGANAIGEASNMIRRGIADVALCGGSEKGVIPIAVAGFSAMRALSERNDDPEHASRPFDRDRDGFVIGEGAGVLVIESLEHALARGATILAEVIGYGSNDDAYHITAPEPDGTGATGCMLLALEEARLEPSDIDYINAHGTSTPLNDASETIAIKKALGEEAYRIPISATKSMTGHLLGAAGAVEAIFCIKSILHGVIPPTMNLEHPDPECDLDYVPNQAREAEIRIALSNSFGFGGHNVSLVFRRFEGA